MRIRAAVLEQTGGPIGVEDIDLAPPAHGEVVVRLRASGVCHSDYNAVDGTAETRCPAVLGHEGAGVVEAVGGGVTRVSVGDRVALSWTPSCALEGRHQTLTWGAVQLGIGQGMLDAVADGLLEASGELLVLVEIWVDPEAEDETALRRAARGATRKALGTCVEGRDPDAAAALVERRDSLRSPFYGGA